jgi:CubicO group peptidase (beta-lactamase class C family)
MGWGTDTADALAAALQRTGAPVVGAGASDGDGDGGGGGEIGVVLAPGDVTSDARFEIGSITKTMTATVLAWLVVGGELRLDDPLSRWLDGGEAADDITLEQLATHTSGLPRLAPNHSTVAGYDRQDPYASFGADEAEQGLRAVEERTTIGTHAYSNFGFQLLDLCLQRATGAPLAELLRTVLFEPLEMHGSTAERDDTDGLLPGHVDGTLTPHWQFVLPGPGGVIAPIGDLVRYGRAVASPPPGRLGGAIRLTCEPRSDTDAGRIGLGWMIRRSGLVEHGGGTAGFKSELVVVPSNGRVVAASASASIDELPDATTLAALGRDPLDAIPQPLDEATAKPWTDVATATSAAFVDRDFAAARVWMQERVAEALTDERMDAVWTRYVEPLGPLPAPAVTSTNRRIGMVAVDLDCGRLHLRVTVDDAYEVAGFQLV